MYLGLPKHYLWLIDLAVDNLDSLSLIATLLKIKQNDTIERMKED